MRKVDKLTVQMRRRVELMLIGGALSRAELLDIPYQPNFGAEMVGEGAKQAGHRCYRAVRWAIQLAWRWA